MIKRIWNEFSFHMVFMKLVVFSISPRQRLRDIKHTTRFIYKYRMKWKFISDPIYIYIVQIAKRRTCPVFDFNMQTRPSILPDLVFACWKQTKKLRFKSRGCGFESHCRQEFFILLFVACHALMAGQLVPYKWNQAWRSSKVYRCIERMIIWKKSGGSTSSYRVV